MNRKRLLVLKILVLGVLMTMVSVLYGCQIYSSDLNEDNSLRDKSDISEARTVNNSKSKIKELSNERIGATFPETVYCDSEEVIVHDCHCIFVYSLTEGEIKECLFEDEIGFPIPLQGDDAVCVNTKDCGGEIYVTSFEKNNVYVYKRSSQSGRHIDIPEKWIQDLDDRQDFSELGLDILKESNVFENDGSVHDEHTLSDGTVVYWTVEGEMSTYKDYRLVLNKDGAVKKYTVFE